MKANNKNYQYLFNLEKRSRYKLTQSYYKHSHIDLSKLVINNLMSNGPCHIVAVFKNYLLEDDDSEYLRRIYKKKESIPRLKKIFLYYIETSVIFPNYTPLVESKYLYNNVIKKQRVIDEQQDLEDKKKDKEKTVKKKRKTTAKFIKSDDKVFSNTAYDEILNVSESILRIVFGLENDNKDKSNDISENGEIDHLIDNLNKAEQKEKHPKIIKKGMKFNKSLKLKINIESGNNVNKLKNNDLVNNITNSTAISTPNSQNLNSKQNNNHNCDNANNVNHTAINFNTIFSNEKGIIEKKIITSPKIKINTNNENIGKIYVNHKKNKSTLPNITLYNNNSISNNINSLNNLIKSTVTKSNQNNRNNSKRNILNTQTNYFKTSNNDLSKNKNKKTKKIISQVPKLDMNKIKSTADTINNFNKTTTNRIIYHGHSNTQTNEFLNPGNRTSRQKTLKSDMFKCISRNPITVVIRSPLTNSKQRSIYKKESIIFSGNKTKGNFGKVYGNLTSKQNSSNNNINKTKKIFTKEILAKSKDFHKKNLLNKI